MTSNLTMWLLRDAYTSDLLSNDARKMDASLEDWGKSYFSVIRHVKKTEASVFVPALFKGQGRNDKDACAVTAMCLDIDEGGDVGVIADHLVSLPFEPMFWAYETFKSTATQRRCRVVIPFAAPLEADWQAWKEQHWPALVAQLGVSNLVDSHCSNISRVYYPPLMLASGEKPQLAFGHGEPWKPVLAPAMPRPKPQTKLEQLAAGSPDAALQALMELGPAVEGEGGDAKTFRAAAIVVRDFGLSDTEALRCLEAWNNFNDPPWAKWQLVRKIENAKRYSKNDRADQAFLQGLKRG